MTYKSFCDLFPSPRVDGVAAWQKVILKVYYDASLLDLSDVPTRSGCYWEFVEEVECYERIKKHNMSSEPNRQIKTKKIYDYGRWKILRDGKKVLLGGFCMLMPYLDDKSKVITGRAIDDACKQIELLSDIGLRPDFWLDATIVTNNGALCLTLLKRSHRRESHKVEDVSRLRNLVQRKFDVVD